MALIMVIKFEEMREIVCIKEIKKCKVGVLDKLFS